MSNIMTPPKLVMLVAFSIYAFVYPFAVLLLSFDWMPFGMEWMSSLLLVLLGVTAGAWLWLNFGVRGVLLSLFVLLTGLALEYVGVQTGIPFGQYSYTGVLVPDLAGGVPIAIGFAWLLVVVGGIFTARWTIQSRQVWMISVFAAVLAVGLDFLLEPVAYHVKGYWQWHDTGGYYGVPWLNFFSWFIAALVMNLLAGRILDITKHANWFWVPIALYLMNVAMFATVNIAHGFWWAGLIGLSLLAGLWLLRRVPSILPARSATTPLS